MKTTYTEGDYEATLHVGNDGEHIHVALVVTNHDDEPFKTSSGMGSWSSINLADENGRLRLESMGSTAAVTQWTIPPGKSLVSKRTTETPSDVRDGRDDSNSGLEFVPSIEEYERRKDEDRVYFAPYVSFPEDSNTEMTATGKGSLGEFPVDLSLTFTPAELDEPIDIEAEYDIAENPTPDISPNYTPKSPDYHNSRYIDGDES